MVGFLALILVCGLCSQDHVSAPVIDGIDIVLEDVFEDGGMTPDFWAYRFANRLHFQTRESVIRQELLFDEGEPVDDEALAQTERNLRALPFLRRAVVEVIPVDEDRVRVRVTASDSWTTIPEARIAKVGNEWVWAVGAAERNLFGYGKQLRLLHNSGLDRDETFVLYQDPRLLGSRVSTGVFLSDASDGHRINLAAGRPFFELDTLWSFQAQFEDFERLDPLYADGERVEELHHLGRHALFEAARAVRRARSSALRVHLGYRYSYDDVADGADLRQFGILQFGVSSVGHNFLKLTHLNRFERPEDVNLGSQASAFFGVSTPALGGEDGTSYFILLASQRGFGLSPDGFLLASVSWQARHRNDNLENSIARARVNLVQKLGRKKVILAKADLRYGSYLDPEVQIRLGAESGLRGYPVRQFNGDRSVLFSVEGRWFIADDVARLASFGVAAFFDSGFAWPERQPMALRDLRSDVGVSLLIGANRMSATRPGVRFDFAYALEPVPGRSPWLISAGSTIGF